MKKVLLLVLFASFLAGCVGQYGETSSILNQEFTTLDLEKEQTKITVIRSSQFRGSGCDFKVSINGYEAALLPANKFVTFYLERGAYLFKVNSQCDMFGIRKSWNVFADGQEQKYFVEQGFWGQISAELIK